MKKFVPKNYDTWIIWCLNNRCNLNCRYCFTDRDNKYSRNQNIDIDSLKNVLNNHKRVFNINFSGGGEPFLVNNLIGACKMITEQHYVSFCTNLTVSHRIRKLAQVISPQKVDFILASAHIEELKKFNLINEFFENFTLLKERGFNIHAVEVAHPSLFGEVSEFRELFKKNGIELKFTPFLGKFHGKEYPKSYTEEQLKTFNFLWGLIVQPREYYQVYKKLCNAGYNAAVVYSNGDVFPCFSASKKIGNIYTGISFKKELILCPFKFCGCPLFLLNPNLYKISIVQTKLFKGHEFLL